MEALDVEARAQIERVQALEEWAKAHRAEMADLTEKVARAEKRAKGLEATLAIEKQKATR